MSEEAEAASTPIPKNEEVPEEESKKDGEDGPKEEESTAVFTPVVSLAEVDVRSGEEDEEVILSVRAKLFIFGETMLDAGTGNKSWKERGVGEVRLLRHREHSRIRLLMRQEKTMKVIANHALDPRIRLEKNAGSNRSWVWSAYDFADGELVETVFALRFSDSSIAENFKDKFGECQGEMEKLLAGEDKGGEGKEEKEVSEKLAELKTSVD